MNYYSHNGITVLNGDCREMLKTLPSESVHCVVTSPPYFGLRDYGTAKWEGGDPTCHHIVGGQVQDNKAPGAIVSGVRPGVDASKCRRCGASRIDQQIGLEQSPDEFAQVMVEVFREIKRVLRSDGTCWLNLGDSYAGYWGDKKAREEGRPSMADTNGWTNGFNMNARPQFDNLRRSGLKPKDLIGIPWLVAFALRADGWYLRSDIVWAKAISFCPSYSGSVMPESVTDRPTKSHEYLFLLTKNERYFYDIEAVKEASSYPQGSRPNEIQGAFTGKRNGSGLHDSFRAIRNTRNLRSVWAINPRPYPNAHFATFPPDLVEPCVLAGTSEKGSCVACGSPYERITHSLGVIQTGGNKGAKRQSTNPQAGSAMPPGISVKETIGWRATCDCYFGPAFGPVKPCVVLDPFAGSGTTLEVAHIKGRNSIGIELNPDYCKLIVDRMESHSMPLFETTERELVLRQTALF